MHGTNRGAVKLSDTFLLAEPGSIRIAISVRETAWELRLKLNLIYKTGAVLQALL